MYTGSPPSCVVEGVEEGNPHLTAEPDGPGVQHVSSSTTSATFTGLAANQTYNFTVFAHNGQGCTASPEVQATPRAAPGTVTQHRRDGRSGRPRRRSLGLPSRRPDRPSGDADSFIYRLSGGTTEGSEYGPVPFTQLPHRRNARTTATRSRCRSRPAASTRRRSAAPTGPTRSRSASRCRSSCRAWMPSRRVAPVDARPGQGYWTWTVAPSAPPYPGVTIDCGPADDPGTPQCEVVSSGPPDNQYPDLVVTITANGTTYTREYSWHEF